MLTDLNATVLGWLGRTSPADAVGAGSPATDRGSLSSAIDAMTSRDTAEQVWRSTHNAFFWTYALADAVVLAAIGLVFLGRRRGAAPSAGPRVAGGRRVRRRGPGRHVPGQPGALVVVLAPRRWPCTWPRPVLALVVALAALAAGRRLASRDPLTPFGLICLFTLVVLGVDVMTGSRLQLETPFGLSVLEAGRFYGIGNEALGIYGIAGLLAAGWLALVLLRKLPVLAAARAARGGRGGGVRGVRLRLARVRRQGRRHHLHGALLRCCWAWPWPGSG